MIPESLSPLANHLWQSTLFAGAAWLLTRTLRKNSARVRHWVWVAASLKFLVPFSVLIGLGSYVHWRTAIPVVTQTNLSMALDQVSRPFTPPIVSSPFLTAVPAAPSPLPAILWTAWACGSIGIGCLWWSRWWRITAAVRAGSPVQLDLPIRTIASSSFLEPGVFGVFRQVLLLPEGIFEHLTREQWKTVIAHELCHVRRRDNLIGLMQMFIETVFWFHPLVWWVGKRIFHERERACDEEVLRLGNEPRTYAQGILKVCEFYLESPRECVAGVSGSNLGRRIEAIMENRVEPQLNFIKKATLVVAGIGALAAPILVGVFNAPYLRAQSQVPAQVTEPAPMFEVASIKPDKSETGVDRIRNAKGTFLVQNVSLKRIIGMAFGVEEGRDYLFSGPGWLDDDRFDIEARYPPETSERDVLRMLQTLLAERFRLQVHREPREFSAYALVTAKGGAKIRARTLGPNDRPVPRRQTQPGHLSASSITLAMLADSLSRPAFQLGRQVVDLTGLTGYFDLTLDWAPMGGADNPTDNVGPSIFTALEEQLGLKLESRRIPIDVLVVDNVDRVPSPN